MTGIRSRTVSPCRAGTSPVGRLVALALAGALSMACGHAGRQAVQEINAGEPVRTAPPRSSTPRVALIMKTLTNPFFVEMEKGARKAQQETHIDLLVRTATQETSIEQQIQLVANEIQDKIQAIVIAPGDSTRLVPILKRAQDAGILIVNIDNRLDRASMAAEGMKPVPFISVDNEKGAFQATRFVVAGIRTPPPIHRVWSALSIAPSGAP